MTVMYEVAYMPQLNVVTVSGGHSDTSTYICLLGCDAMQCARSVLTVQR
jgi:hypothetical protein